MASGDGLCPSQWRQVVGSRLECMVGLGAQLELGLGLEPRGVVPLALLGPLEDSARG